MVYINGFGIVPFWRRVTKTNRKKRFGSDSELVPYDPVSVQMWRFGSIPGERTYVHL